MLTETDRPQSGTEADVRAIIGSTRLFIGQLRVQRPYAIAAALNDGGGDEWNNRIPRILLYQYLYTHLLLILRW